LVAVARQDAGDMSLKNLLTTENTENTEFTEEKLLIAVNIYPTHQVSWESMWSQLFSVHSVFSVA